MRIRISEPCFFGNEEQYVMSALRKRELSGGFFVRKFEEEFAKRHSAKHGMVTSSGTSALHLALLAMKLELGQRVVMPACSYIATANAVRYCDATPIFVDVDPETWTMDVVQAEQMVKETAAVGMIPVHLYGVPSAWPKLPNKWVVEDACEAHGLTISGDASVFSFYGNKIITCGEGGAVITNRDDVAKEVALLRGQGTTGQRRYWHERLGYNYRMGELQAAVGLAQIEKLPIHLQVRRYLREVYEHCLPDVPRQKFFTSTADWVMPVLVPNRDEVAYHMQGVGVETRPVFPPLHKQPQYLTKQYLPVAERLAREGLLLPLHPQMTEEDVRFICSELCLALRRVA